MDNWIGVGTPVLQPQLTGEEQYSESYTLSADLSDGSFVLFFRPFLTLVLGMEMRLVGFYMYRREDRGSIEKRKFVQNGVTMPPNHLEVGTCSIQQSTS